MRLKISNSVEITPHIAVYFYNCLEAVFVFVECKTVMDSEKNMMLINVGFIDAKKSLEGEKKQMETVLMENFGEF